MTGYGDSEKACSLIDFKHFISSTGVVKVLHSQIHTLNISLMTWSIWRDCYWCSKKVFMHFKFRKTDQNFCTRSDISGVPITTQFIEISTEKN